MNEELVFSQTIQEICELAKSQGNVVSEEQISGAFAAAGIALGSGQLALVHEYLKSKKVGIGKVSDPFDYMTEEEIDYLDTYLQALSKLPEATDGEQEAITLSAMAGDIDAKNRLIELFLPRVVEIAKLYAGQGVFLEDLVGEGNVSLTMAVEMLGTAANAAEAQGSIASMIMEAMENYIAENADEKSTATKMADRANDVLERAKELSEAFGRKVTPEELSEETGMSIERIKEAVRITADHIEYIQ